MTVLNNPVPQQLGIKNLAFSASGRLLAFKNEHQPCLLYIYDCLQLVMAQVVKMNQPVGPFSWKQHTLAMVNNQDGRLYLWTLGVMTVTYLQDSVHSQVTQKGASLLLTDKTQEQCTVLPIEP